MALSRKHAVESTVIGEYTDTGKLHITYDGKTCACIDLDLLSSGFPQWEFDADWQRPETRGSLNPFSKRPTTIALASGHAVPAQSLLQGMDHPAV